MGKLDELKQLVAESFKAATEQQDIERLAKINNAIEDVSKEQDALVAKNAELIKSYKDLIQHTSIKPDSNVTDDVAPTPVSFEDALKSFMSNKK